MSDRGKSTQSPLGENLRSAYSDTVDEGVPAEFQELIDRNLKQAFDDTVSEGVPDRFADLIAQLSEKTKNAGTQ
ncbi:NepR family anti-sigma factor [Aliishimia ponticola]|uniref:NepR family anti-sigma factor n=1 Tax=Aliishimia ponticola TaxID=2499833 RepID=UPI0014560538|nr:NepR family anti-sigma factor [Aliishimia ponticola]